MKTEITKDALGRLVDWDINLKFEYTFFCSDNDDWVKIINFIQSIDKVQNASY